MSDAKVVRGKNFGGRIILWATRQEGRLYGIERGLTREQAKRFGKWWEQSYGRAVALRGERPNIEQNTEVELALYHFKNEGV